MSSSKALESLTACYTDSENEDDGDNRDETAMELETSEEDVKEVAVDEAEYDFDMPPEPAGKCSVELLEKVKGMFDRMENEGYDFNQDLQKKKSFRNPSIYEKLIDFCSLNELGTNYPPHIFDPFKWGKESHYDELGKVQKIEMDKREKEKKDLKAKVEIVSGTAKKVAATNGGVLLDTKRKKSKWDQQGP